MSSGCLGLAVIILVVGVIIFGSSCLALGFGAGFLAVFFLWLATLLVFSVSGLEVSC